jgi:hypothetical protein
VSRLTFENGRDYPSRQDQFFYLGRDFYRDRRDKSRLSRQSKIFEIFEGNGDFFEINRDFVEINRDFFSLDRDILDFRHLWKVVGEGFTLTFLSLPWVTF